MLRAVLESVERLGRPRQVKLRQVWDAIQYLAAAGCVWSLLPNVFLRDLERAAPMKITRILTDNGKEFTDRLFGLRKRAATGNHDFDRLCADLGIEHRLAPPMRPQTNGMVERFNGRIEDVMQSHRFRSGEDLEQTILRPAPAIRAERQNAHRHAQGLASPEPGHLQEAAVQSHGI
jgi:transposase InsO family protein